MTTTPRNNQPDGYAKARKRRATDAGTRSDALPDAGSFLYTRFSLFSLRFLSIHFTVFFNSFFYNNYWVHLLELT